MKNFIEPKNENNEFDFFCAQRLIKILFYIQKTEKTQLNLKTKKTKKNCRFIY